MRSRYPQQQSSKFKRPTSAKRPQSVKPLKQQQSHKSTLKVKMPSHLQDNYDQSQDLLAFSSSKQQQQQHHRSRQRPKSAKKPTIHSKQPFNYQSKVPLVQDDYLKMMSKSELEDLFEQQQQYIQDQLKYTKKSPTQSNASKLKLSSKKASVRKKSRQPNKDLKTTLDSYKAKPVKAVHGLQQQPQTQINNFFLNLQNPSDLSQVLSSQNGLTPQPSIPQTDQGYKQLSDDEFMHLLKSNQIAALSQNPSLKSFLEQKIIQNQLSKTKGTDFYSEVYQVLQGGVQHTQSRLKTTDPLLKSQKFEEYEMERIERQKKELDLLLKKYHIQDKAQATQEQIELQKQARIEARERKLQQIQEKKFRDELMRQKRQIDYHRENQSAKLTEKIYTLASKIEKSRFINEKQEYREKMQQKTEEQKKMLQAIEQFYGDKVQMLREQIKNEKFERMISTQAQKEVLDKVRREHIQVKGQFNQQQRAKK